MTPERIARLHAVLQKRQPDMTVITDFVHKERNLSAVVRTCDAVGIGKIFSVIDEKDYYAFHGTARGSHQWVEVERKNTVTEAAAPLKAKGYQIIGADVTTNSVDYREVDYSKPFALLLGAEKSGLSPEARACIDQFVTVPMVGMVESFNVSVAAAIILTEAMHQREAAGLYQQQRIDDALYQRLFFEWGHPQVRDFCQKNQLAYPALTEEGEIDQPAAWYKKVREQMAGESEA
jgi:tRNA (guanosine-2'-O-)-methyltransferase